MITLNENRIGRFTSSENYRLIGNGEREMTELELAEYKKANPKGRKKTIEDVNILSSVALSYIEEKQMEIDLCRSIETESDAMQLRWGKHLEQYAFLHLRNIMDFELVSQETEIHQKYDRWAGSVDIKKKLIVGDIKCPFTIKSFVQLIRPLYLGLSGIDAINAIRFGFSHNGINYDKHKDAEKYYWQIVSNACIHNANKGCLVVYMPYKDELIDIQLNCEGDNSLNWLYHSNIEKLPYLLSNGIYKNLNIIEFDIPKSDIELLENKIKLATNKLNL